MLGGSSPLIGEGLKHPPTSGAALLIFGLLPLAFASNQIGGNGHGRTFFLLGASSR